MSRRSTRHSTVKFKNQDEGLKDKKYEGYSNLQGAVKQQRRRLDKDDTSDIKGDLESEYIANLHRQIVIMEREVSMLKEREIEQKNQASGYETLLKDKIPLNEHILALKNKFNNERSVIEKSE